MHNLAIFFSNTKGINKRQAQFNVYNKLEVREIYCFQNIKFNHIHEAIHT